MAEMTSYERVLTALNHQEPDRVPMAIGGGPYGIVDSLYFEMVKHYGLGEPVAPFRSGHTINHMDDRVLKNLGGDIRYVWMNGSPTSPHYPTDDPEVFLDEFGQPWKQTYPYYSAVDGILADAKSVDDIDRLVKWPDTTDPKWLVGVRERAKYLKEETDYFVSARMVMSHGIYQMACDLRNMDQFMIDMALDKKFAGAVMERVTDTIVGLCKVYMEEAGEYFDMIELPGDDYGANENLVMSPRMFRKQIKPHIKRIVDTIRSYKPDIKIMLHSDGMIAPLMEDMIELGIDVVHPLEPLPSMNLPEIKEKYGDRLSFLGAIDISHAMPGTIDEVIAEAKLRISQLAPGGGYILAPSNHMQSDVPLENVIALYEAARKYGTYPINI